MLELIQSPENNRDFTKLNHLLFSPIPSSPRRFFQITCRLDSLSTALKFLDYVKANSPPESDRRLLSSTFQAILELATREPNSPNLLLELYKTSKEQNVSLNSPAAVLLLRRLGRAGMADEALAVFSELDSHTKNTYVRNVIIDLLLKTGRVDSAMKVLDEMLLPGSEFRPNDITADIVFTKLLKVSGWEGRVREDEIAGLVAKFGKHHVFPNAITLTQLISRLCRSRNTDLAWNVLDDVMKLNGLKDVAPCNALLTGLGKEREFEKMNLLMRRMKDMDIQPNVITFGILINHLCKFRRIDDALEVFERMKGEKEAKVVAPDAITYNTLIDGLCKVGRQEEGSSLMRMMRSDGCVPNTVTYNCLIDGYCKSGEIEKAHELFNQMANEQVVPNVITLNTLVDGMCKHGRISSAVEFLREMQQKGLKGNSVTYTVFINAFCKVNNIDKAMEFFDEMFKAGCFPDSIVYYTLICGLAQAGRLDDASFVMSKLKEAGFRLDLVCFNILISEFCKRNKLDKANELLNEMELVGVKPDSVTYNTLISYFSRTGNFKLAHKFMKRMTKHEGLLPTVFTYGALIHAYCLNNNTDEAMKLFKEMSAASKVPPNTVIYNILIDSLCKKNEVDYALSLFDDMKVRGVKPNTTTYNAVFKALWEKNWLDKAFELMDRMVEQACNADYITMEILTEWLSSVGETTKLKKFTQGYKVSTSPA